jgi:phosphoribosylanthranilate isomerase
MLPSAHPRVKVCCISSAEEAWLAIRAGASALGLVSAMPSGPGVIELGLAAEIIRQVPPGVSTFLLTCAQDAGAIIRAQRQTRASALQLVDEIALADYAVLRRELPGIHLVQVIHVTGEEAVAQARTVAPHVDAVLLDSGNPQAAVKELGGTGRVHDWALSARIREAIPVPLYLAGGLNPGNVAAAVAQVRPFGVDVCSGVRREGRLESGLLARFMAAAAADAPPPG